MNRILSLFFLAAAVTDALVPQTKISETFESASFPPSDWSVQYTSPLYWERQAVGAFGMSGASAAFLFFEAPELTQQSLLSPVFSATVPGDSLSFDHAYASYESRVDSLIIEASTDGGATFFRILALAGGTVVGTGMVTASPSPAFFTPTAQQWGQKRIGLPAGVNRLRFRAYSDFGNNLFLDNISVAQAFVNDVGVSLISQPRYFLNLPFPVTPVARITNYGVASQSSPFTTTLRITGPAGYLYSSASSDTLPAGTSTFISFPTPFAPTLPGTYEVQCYTNLTADQFRQNDTLRQTIVAGNFNYGTNGGTGTAEYFFTNSLPGNGAPAHPPTGWKDTSGNIDLIVDGVALAPMTGDIDDGYFTLAGIFPGRSFRLFGTNYSDTVHISTNGIISFTQGFEDFVPAAIPSGQGPNGALYPFWADLDFSDPDVAGCKLSYKIDGDFLVVTYTRAPRFNLATDSTDYVTFQVSLRFSPSPTLNSFMQVEFNYAATGSGFLTAYEQFSFPHLVGGESANGTEAVTYRFVHGSTPLTPGPLFGSSLSLTLGPSYASYVQTNIRAMLEGAFSLPAQRMRTDLGPLLPSSQPYNTTPWEYTGGERGITIPDSVVDWVLMELRTDTLSASAVARRAGFILNGGRIVDLDGDAALRFDLFPSGSYYIALYHRNHLPVMSRTPVNLSGSSPVYDFTLSQASAYGTSPMKELSPGVFGMLAGDVNRSGIITASDANEVYSDLNSAVYTFQDVNMSGIVTAADANMLFGNLNRASAVPAAPSILPDRSHIQYLTFPSSRPGAKKHPSSRLLH